MPLTKIQSLGITDGTIVNADINASAAIAGTKLTGVNDAKAWVSFNGTGTPAIRGSFNVSSITDNGTGDYTVNFTTALTDANFSAQSSVGNDAGGFSGLFTNIKNRAAGSIRIDAERALATTDPTYVDVAVFR
jgi:hypothetical protein